METGEAPQLTCSRGSRTRARIEVFSAMLENTDLPSAVLGYKDFFGVILLHSCNRNFVIFDSKVLEPPQVNPEGHITLTGPNYMDKVLSIPVEDEVLILPWLIDVVTCCMDQSEHVLWKSDENDMDRVICKKFKCIPCINLHVNFAVYSDPVETHVNVYFVDLDSVEADALVRVHGTVSTSNSLLLADSKAESILFHKLSGDSVSLKPGICVPLTLSRRITVIPHQSILLVHVNIRVCVGHEPEFDIKEKLEFNPSSECAEKFIILPDHGRLLVKAAWVECEDSLVEYQSHS